MEVSEVVSRQKASALSGAFFALGLLLGLTVALLGAKWHYDAQLQQVNRSMAVVQSWLEHLATAEPDAFGDMAQSTPESVAEVSQAVGTDSPQGRVGLNDAEESALKPDQADAPRLTAQNQTQMQTASQSQRPHVRLQRTQVGVRSMTADMLEFNSGRRVRVGQALPSGAQLLALDPIQGVIETSERTIEMPDWGSWVEANRRSPAQQPARAMVQAPLPGSTVAAAPPVAPSAAVAVPRPPAAAQSTSSTVVPAGAVSVPVLVPAAAPAAPTAAAAAPATESSSVNASAVVRISPEQANIEALTGQSVRFRSGRVVERGELFPSGERLLNVVPSEGKIITDRRVIILTVNQ